MAFEWHGSLWKTLWENTMLAVFEDWSGIFRLKSYSTNAPIEQVLIHWEDGHLLPSKKAKEPRIVPLELNLRRFLRCFRTRVCTDTRPTPPFWRSN